MEKGTGLDGMQGRADARADAAGRATYVVRWRIEGQTVQSQSWYRGTTLWYDTPGHVYQASTFRWRLDGAGHIAEQHAVATGSYLYDSGRQRYRVKTTSAAGGSSDRWTDFAGDDVYSDFGAMLVSGGQMLAQEKTAREPGVGEW